MSDEVLEKGLGVFADASVSFIAVTSAIFRPHTQVRKCRKLLSHLPTHVVTVIKTALLTV